MAVFDGVALCMDARVSRAQDVQKRLMDIVDTPRHVPFVTHCMLPVTALPQCRFPIRLRFEAVIQPGRLYAAAHATLTRRLIMLQRTGKSTSSGGNVQIQCK
ncbi:MAG: hypothetical protein M3A44_05150 [Gammaproteobacteria bacterium]